MQHHPLSRRQALAAVLLPATWPAAHAAEAYPSRPIRLIVGFAPGGPVGTG